MIVLEHTREQVLSGTATVLSCVAVLIWCTALAAQQDKDAARAKTIINRILAREEAITSAGFVYCRSGVWLREGALKIDEGPIQFFVENDGWKIKQQTKGDIQAAWFVETTRIRLCRDGCLIDFRVESVRSSAEGHARISREATFKRAMPLHKLDDPPPYWAGTLQYRSTANYIRDNIDRVRLGGRAMVGSHDTLVLEWEVPQDDAGKAFHAMSRSLSRDGGVLRLYVAPQLGFALPLVEYVSRAGDVQTSFLCSGFREVGDGIFFPRSVTRSTANGVSLNYSISAMETVNQVTSRDNIDVVLPEGTMILGANEIGLLGVRLDRDTPASELTAKIKAARTSDD